MSPTISACDRRGLSRPADGQFLDPDWPISAVVDAKAPYNLIFLCMLQEGHTLPTFDMT